MASFVFANNIGGPRQGGFQDHDMKTKDDYDDTTICIRDGCQNCKDRNIEGGKVTVKITIIELTGSYKENFLKMLSWSALDKHIVACTTNNLHNRALMQLEEGRKKINKKEPLRLLLLEDFGTQGLTGKDEYEEGNFNLLLYSENYTPPTNDRGGSHGIGKKVLWYCSNIKTVLFSSYPNDPQFKNKGIRLTGKAWLASHQLDNKKFQYSGHFGNKIQEANVDKAESIFGDSQLAKNLYLDRNNETTTGTSALIIGFQPPDTIEKDSYPSLEEMAEKISFSINHSFWPSLTKKFTCDIDFEIFIRRNENINSFRKIDKPSKDFLPYSKLLLKTDNKKKRAINIDEIANKTIKYKIPKRLMKIGNIGLHSEFEYKNELSIIRIKEVKKDSPLIFFKNKVALVRGFGMVVRYLSPNKNHLGDLPFVGVFTTGTANGNTIADEKAEDYYRHLEPGLHDDWKALPGINDLYDKGTATRLIQQRDDIGDVIQYLTGEVSKEGEDGPEGLKKLIGGSAGRSTTQVDNNIETIKPVEQHWMSNDKISVKFKVRRISSDDDLNISIYYYLKSEKMSATTDSIIPFENNKIVVGNNLSTRSLNTDNSFILSKEHSDFTFEATLNPNLLKENKPEIYRNYNFRKILIKPNITSSKISKENQNGI